MKKLSIIIVTYNSENDIFDCISSIQRYSDMPQEELELIIVDNNSREPQTMFSRLREQWGDDIIIIENTRNGGYGQGNNMGIRRATAPVILIMNPDVRLMQPVFRTALDAFTTDQQLCMYGMKQMLGEQIKSPLSFDCSYRINGYLTTLLTPACNRLDLYIPSFMYFSGSCFFISKEKFLQVGLFDEDIFMYGEEDDIHWRLKKAFGNHFVYNNKLRYIHRSLGRKPSLKTEEAMLNSIVLSNKKKGIRPERTIRNRLYNARMRLLREQMRSKTTNNSHSEDIRMLREFIANMKQKLHE